MSTTSFPPKPTTDLYDTTFVAKLFDEMSASYDRVNEITSFGFSQRWRKQFLAPAAIQPGMTVYDLMCGMGECWNNLAAQLQGSGQILALDFSEGMLHGAQKRRAAFPTVQLTKQDVLANSLPAASADVIVSAFGIKTFSDEQKLRFAQEIARLLKPGGRFSLIEISVPPNALLRVFYRFYLNYIIPWLGRMLLGNPENYRMLGVYTEKFVNAEFMRDCLARQNLEVRYHNYFFGCATGISGQKPLS